MIGQTISHYKILEILGEGAMEMVYEPRTQSSAFLPFLSKKAAEDVAVGSTKTGHRIGQGISRGKMYNINQR